MIRILLFQVLLLAQSVAFAQKDCRTAEYRQQVISNSPLMTAKIAAIEAFTQNAQKGRTTVTLGNDLAVSTPKVITIPVVVHIVYNSSAQNISDAQVLSQIAVLNADYARQNADTANTPLVFRQFAADCGFRFELAKVDTMGYATTGIVRKHTGILGFAIDDRIKFSGKGGDDAWDRDRYLNIWVGSLSGGIIGYSSVVGGPKDVDGVVISYTAFGNTGTATAPFNKGRTATHEIGHWLNLIHTWGDADCGNDQVDDTPPQSAADRGCPGGIIISCNNGPNGNMYSNYMDLTNDQCMNIFTYGQRERMQSLFIPGGERYAMLSSNALIATPLNGTPVLPVTTDNDDNSALKVSLFPNPATSIVSVQISDESAIGSTLDVYNQVGQKVLSTTIGSLLLQLNVSSFSKGIYYIKINHGKSRNMTKLVKM